jgi:Protein of unknown function (DUF2917)
MPHQPPALTLLQGHTRLINASEGFHLEVLSGCLWLTRPGDAVDRFLVAGSRIELHENQVLIQSDKTPGIHPQAAGEYRLTPLRAVVQTPAFWASSAILRLKNIRNQTAMPRVTTITAALIKP